VARRIRRGSQVPTFSTVGGWAYSEGDYAADMFGGYGVRFYESQKMELVVFLARDVNDDFAARTICISKPRQNGKSFAARFYAIWMAAIEGKNVLFSAHHGETVRKMFKAIKDFINANPDFKQMLKPNRQGIYAAKGSEGIYFVDDDGNDAGMIEFQTRTTSGARGQTYQIVIVDEAQELTDDQLDALKPTTLAATDLRGDDDEDLEYADDADGDDDEDEGGSGPQMIYLGTPPNEKCPGTVFRDYHDRAHEDAESSIWWMEWAVDEVPDMSDRKAVMELVYLTNPAMGLRIKRSTMIDFIDTMSAEGFARECLGWWSPIAVNVTHPISKDDWGECEIDANDRPDDGVYTCAVRFSPEGTGVVAICLLPDSGRPYVEVVAVRRAAKGTTWYVDFLMDVCNSVDAIVIDGKGYAQTVNDKLIDAGVDEDVIQRPNVNEVIADYSGFVDAVSEHAVSHIGQAGLTESAVGCVRRKIGNAGGFGFDSNGNADATLVDACALALGAAMRIHREPTEEMMINL
jgi:hypothetical protein